MFRSSVVRFGSLQIAWLVVCGAMSSFAFAQKQEYRIAPSASWVTPVAFDESSSTAPDKAVNGTHYLLLDTQTRIEPKDQFVYRRVVRKALNERGVDAVAQIDIGFNPVYQTVALHGIAIRRGGKTLPKLASASIKVLQRETSLEYRIYNGAKTVNIFLDDVRVGDIVDFDYTIRGVHPLFTDRRFGWVDLQWRVPVAKSHTRLIWPAERSIRMAYQNTEQSPVIKDFKGFHEYVWETKDTPGLTVESDAPDWFDPYAAIQWSEFSDWEAVAAWAEPLYRTSELGNSPVVAEAQRIAAKHQNPEARLLAALNYVQSEVRYLGIEIGTSTHQPSPPAKVLERRFGDCKDKSLLMVAMLRAMGIEAHPALVHTRIKRNIGNYLPSPRAFNHAIVRAKLDGKDYWLDPTRDPQKGTLENLYQPDYGFALVLAPKTSALTSMTSTSPVAHKKTVSAVFDSSQGQDKPVRYTVKTVHEAASADDIRGDLAGENHAELQKRYLNFYAKYYPEIEVAAPFGVEDDSRENRVTVTEHYWLKSFWKRNEDRKRLQAFISSPDVDALLVTPKHPIRTSPLRIDHPAEIQQRTEVLLPRDWDITPSQKTISDKAFRFDQTVGIEGRRFLISNRFLTLADHVPADEVGRYTENMKKADQEIGYWLYTHDKKERPPFPTTGDLSLPALTFFLIVALFSTFGAIWVYRYDPPPRLPANSAGPRGLGGGLTILAVVAVLSPFLVLGFMNASYLSASKWTSLTTPGLSGYHALWGATMYCDLAATAFLFVFDCLLAVLLFQKRSSVPLIYALLAAINVALHVAGAILLGVVSPKSESAITVAWGLIVFKGLWFCMWGGYLWSSSRPRATFTTTFADADGPGVPAAAVDSQASPHP